MRILHRIVPAGPGPARRARLLGLFLGFTWGLLAIALVAQADPVASGDPTSGSPSEGATQAWWVFFQDRGGQVLDREEMARVAERIPASVWARRSGGPSALPEERDLPLWEPYVEEVAGLGTLRHRSLWLNAVSVNLSPAALAEVGRLSFVREVRPVALGRREGLGPMVTPDGTLLETTLPLREEPGRGPFPYGASYGQLQEIGVPALHAAGYTGNRVLLMMLDTGFRKDHNAFASTHIRAEWDFVFEDGNTQNEPVDDPGQHSHGTGTWAVAGGFDPGHIVGPAYRADFVLAKTEDLRSETQAEEDNYVAALEWADQLGVRVTSASLSYTCFDDGYCYDYPLKDGDTPVISRAVDIAAARGILCVNSAGNYGYLGPRSLGTPADADSIVSVAAVDSLNVLAEFSSRGPSDDGRLKPEVAARGVDTWWADANGASWYGPASGTSLSCPLVGGAAALLVEAHPEWGAMDIRSALMNTADRHTHPDNDYGWGRINLPSALTWRPVRFPVPFSLLTPADGAGVNTVRPLLRWRSSRDPDALVPLVYRVRLFETAPGGNEWSLPAGTDTSLVIPFSLTPQRQYGWEVTAEDVQGNRRLSRETYRFTTPLASGVPEEGASAATGPLVLSAGPNPGNGAVSFDLEAPAGLDAGTGISWAVYDAIGRRVAEASAGGGVRSGIWDGRDLQGTLVPGGVYFLEVRLAGQSARKTLVRLTGQQ